MLASPEIRFSPSEESGIQLLGTDDLLVYSVGVSTGGIAEIRMAQENPARMIIATTIDIEGARLANKLISEQGLADRAVVKIEDVSQPLPYPDNYFDFIYARLVLHYLSKQQLNHTLRELKRTLKSQKKMFVVVRSTDCPDATRPGVVFDPATGLTTFKGGGYDYSRYFHTPESITTAITQAGFSVLTTKKHDEQLFKDFMRKQVAPHSDNVIEVVAQK
jgi:SAM-dependent methyltransferase